MQSKKIIKSVSLGIKTLSLAVASSCLVYSVSNAAGLGKLSVLSALGQPLRAEIELTSVAKEEIGKLVPKLASYAEFQQAHIDYGQALSSLRFAIEDRGSRHFVLITSTQAMNDPFVEILVELNSSKGRLIREYSVLLEPAEIQANPAPTSSENRTAAITAQKNVTLQTTGSARNNLHKLETKLETKSKSNLQNSQAITENKNAEYYKIENGDTLSRIANQFKYEGTSLEQMLVAIQRINPSVFIDNNMNLIRAGDMVMIPELSEVQRIDRSDAKKVIAAHSADFNAYRNRLADQVADMQPEESTDTKKINSGKITAKAIEIPTPANESKDKLKLSKANVKEQGDLRALDEEKIAQQIELQAANERIKELEKNTENLKKILALQDETSTTLLSTSPSTSLSTSASTNNIGAAANSSASSTSAASTSAASTFATSTPLPAIETAASVAAPIQPKQPEKVAVPTIKSEPNIVIDWIRYLPYGAILLALFASVGIYLSRRKKVSQKVSKHVDEKPDLISSRVRANLLLRSSSVDDSQTAETGDSLFHSNLAPSISHLEVSEVDQAIDPLVQADAYIAHGRYQQAEELLNEAVRAEPNRQPLRIKLLEIYAHEKDSHSFEAMARKIYQMTGGHGPDWAKVVAMGVIIDPQIVNFQKDQAETPSATSVFEKEDKKEPVNASLGEDDIHEPHFGSTPEVNSEEVIQPSSEQTVSENSHMLDFDIPTSNQEPLVQVETNPRSQATDSQNLGSTNASFMDIDFSGIDLDLPKMAVDVDQDKPKNNLNIHADKTPAASIEVIAEQMSTKLDLADAYQKIGDKDGARELLKEVLQSGSQEQVTTAKTMMSELV